jgi:hypothetical protein
VGGPKIRIIIGAAILERHDVIGGARQPVTAAVRAERCEPRVDRAVTDPADPAVTRADAAPATDLGVA